MIDGISQLEPATWYAVTVRCNTTTCERCGIVTDIPQFYSNDGTYLRVQCYPCQTDTEILTATKLDPQPAME